MIEHIRFSDLEGWITHAVDPLSLAHAEKPSQAALSVQWPTALIEQAKALALRERW